MDGFRNDLVHIKCVRTRVDLLEHNIQGRNGVILLEDGKQSFLVVDNGGAGQVQSKQWVLRQTRVEYLLDLREVGKVMREPSQDPRQRETGNVSARRDHFIALRIHFSEQSHQQLQGGYHAWVETFEHEVADKETGSGLHTVEAQVLAESQQENGDEVVETLVVVEMRVFDEDGMDDVA